MAQKAKSRQNRDSVLRSRLLIAGLVLFVIFDVALVAFALTNTKPASTAGTVVERVETTTDPTPEPAQPAEVEPVVAPPVESVPPNRLLTALDATTAWRAATGECPVTSASPELTTDSGATWDGFNASVETDASSILTISVSNESEASMVTLKASDCTPQRVTTFVAGEEWQDYPERVTANWFVDPANRASVHSPAGAFAAPCSSVIALASRSDSVGAVLCSDGTLARTDSGGETWGAGTPLPGVMNINVSDDGYVLVAANQSDCAGAQILSTSEALDGALVPGGCREAEFSPGDLAISSAGGIVWLWAGDVVSRSSDGGLTWQ